MKLLCSNRQCRNDRCCRWFIGWGKLTEVFVAFQRMGLGIQIGNVYLPGDTREDTWVGPHLCLFESSGAGASVRGSINCSALFRFYIIRDFDFKVLARPYCSNGGRSTQYNALQITELEPWWWSHCRCQ